MTLGSDIAAALPYLRTQAESRMVDSCTIVDGEVEAEWDAATGVWTTPDGASLYDGKCRVRQPSPGNPAEAGESTFNVSDRIVSIPMTGEGYGDGVEGIPVGAQVLITSAANDAFLTGARLTYFSPASQQTDSTARRLLCRKVD